MPISVREGAYRSTLRLRPVRDFAETQEGACAPRMVGRPLPASSRYARLRRDKPREPNNRIGSLGTARPTKLKDRPHRGRLQLSASAVWRATLCRGRRCSSGTPLPEACDASRRAVLGGNGKQDRGVDSRNRRCSRFHVFAILQSCVPSDVNPLRAHDNQDSVSRIQYLRPTLMMGDLQNRSSSFSTF